MLQSIAKAIDAITQCIGRLFSLLTLATVLIMFFSVIQRYLFSHSYIWQQELISYTHAICFMTVSGYALMKNEHVRVDVLYHNFSERTRSYIEIIGTLLFLIPFAIAILYFSSDYIASSWKITEPSREANGLPFVYILKTFIAVFAITLLLQSISVLCSNIASLISPNKSESA